MQSVTSRRVPTSRCGTKVKLHVTSHHVTTSAIPCMTRLQAVTARRHVMSGRDAVYCGRLYTGRHVTSRQDVRPPLSRHVTSQAPPWTRRPSRRVTSTSGTAGQGGRRVTSRGQAAPERTMDPVKFIRLVTGTKLWS